MGYTKASPLERQLIKIIKQPRLFSYNMVRTGRRKFLLATSCAVVTMAGCQRFRSESPNSLVVENRHDLPHVVMVEVVTYAPDNGSRLSSNTGQVQIEPGATQRYVDYFDPSFGYEVTARIPSGDPVEVPYGRDGVETSGNLVFFVVTKTGALNGGVRTV